MAAKTKATQPEINLDQLAADIPAGASAQFDLDQLALAAPTLDDMGEPLPERFSGKSPETAMNQSVVDGLTRFQMSFGNKQGNIQKLREQFEDVQEIKNKEGKPTGELAVRRGPHWYRVDPSNGDIADPWEKTKEYMRDVADLGPVGVGVGVAAAPLLAGAATVGGAAATAAAAGAATGAINTSLGRIYGTYSATPEEQLEDIAYETGISALTGGVFKAGAKPTATAVAGMLEKGKAGMSKMSEATKGAFRSMFGKFTSIGERNFNTLVDNTDDVVKTMRTFDSMAEKDPLIYHKLLSDDSLKKTSDVIDASQNTMSAIYRKMTADVLNTVDEIFTANPANISRKIYEDAIKSGIGALRDAKGNLLNPKNSMDLLAKIPVGAPIKNFTLLSPEQISNNVKRTGQTAVQSADGIPVDLLQVSGNKEVYKMLKSFYTRVGDFQLKSLKGKDGAAQLMTLKKHMTSLHQEFSNSDVAEQIPGIKSIFDRALHSTNSTIADAFGTHSAVAKQRFLNVHGKYTELSDAFAPLLKLHKQYKRSGNIETLQPALTALTSASSTGGGKVGAMRQVQKVAKEFGLPNIASQMASYERQIAVNEAARSLQPIRSGMSGTVSSMATTAAIAGNPGLATAMLAGNAARSPLVARLGAQGAQAVARSVNPVMRKGLSMLQSLPQKQLQAMANNEQAQLAFVNALSTAVSQKMSMQDAINQVMPQE